MRKNSLGSRVLTALEELGAPTNATTLADKLRVNAKRADTALRRLAELRTPKVVAIPDPDRANGRLYRLPLPGEVTPPVNRHDGTTEATSALRAKLLDMINGGSLTSATIAAKLRWDPEQIETALWQLCVAGTLCRRTGEDQAGARQQVFARTKETKVSTQQQPDPEAEPEPEPVNDPTVPVPDTHEQWAKKYRSGAIAGAIFVRRQEDPLPERADDDARFAIWSSGELTIRIGGQDRLTLTKTQARALCEYITTLQQV